MQSAIISDMKVLVIGGTGFLGYYTCLKLLARGHAVSALARPPLPTEDLLPAEVRLTLADLDSLPDEELLELLRGQDGLIFAAGVDDRVDPASPAYPFFYKGNVLATERMMQLAVEAGVGGGASGPLLVEAGPLLAEAGALSVEDGASFAEDGASFAEEGAAVAAGSSASGKSLGRMLSEM